MSRPAALLPTAALSALFALLCAAGTSGQGFCPPGTHIVPSSSPFAQFKCVPGAAPVNAVPRIPDPVPVSVPSVSAAQCPPGSYSVPTNSPSQPYLCAPEDPDARAGTDSAGDCAAFNARLAAFHSEFVAEAEAESAELDETISQLRAAIRRQKALRQDLVRQAFRARDPGIRRHLYLQAQSVSADTTAKQQELRELLAERRSARATAKSRYKAQAGAMLAEAPADCQVRMP